jgi:hypothetical protein
MNGWRAFIKNSISTENQQFFFEFLNSSWCSSFSQSHPDNEVHRAISHIWACYANMAFLLAELRRLQARQTLAVALTRQLAYTRAKTAELRRYLSATHFLALYLV